MVWWVSFLGVWFYVWCCGGFVIVLCRWFVFFSGCGLMRAFVLCECVIDLAV